MPPSPAAARPRPRPHIRIRSRRLSSFFDDDRNAAQILRSNLIVDSFVACIEAVTVLGLAIWLDSTAGVLYAVGLACLNLVRMSAFRWYRRGDIATGLLIVIFASWAFSLPGVWLIPQGYPIHVINVVSPLVLAVAYLSGEWVRRLTVVGVIYVIALGYLAFYNDGIAWAELFPARAFEFSILSSLTAMVLLFTLDVRDANIQMLRNLDRAADASQALRESRRRLVTVADAERVRIERNIHDGAQQQLVAIAIRLKLAADQTDDEAQQHTLEQLHVQTKSALDELRELSRGVYPSGLGAHGIVEALRSVARRSANHVDVSADIDIDLGEAEQAAVYFVCLEAMQNAAKHAGHDSTTTVALEPDCDVIRVTITDDGPGFDLATHGHKRGLLNMADRVAALGGELSITSELGRGTVVTAHFPTAGSGNA